MTIGRRPDSDVFLDDVTVSRDHALLVRRGGDYYLDDLGSLNGTYVNRQRGSSPTASRTATSCRSASTSSPSSRADGRGRPGRPEIEPPSRPSRPRPARRAKSMTIGAVCKALAQEFPDISISKIRYLEDQKLLAPRRTPGGYRLYTQRRRRAPAHDPAPAARRVPAAARDPPGARRGPRRATTSRPARGRAERRRARARAPRVGDACATAARCTRSRTWSRRRAPSRSSSRELEEYGVIKGEMRGGVQATTTRPSARSSARSPSWPATASAGATCACSAPRPTARRRCCSRSSPRRCARATPSGARRRSRRSRTSRRSRRTSSTCCSIRDLRKIVALMPASLDREPARAASATSPTSRKPGIVLQGHHAAAGRRRRRSTQAVARAGRATRGRCDVDVRHRRRGARLPARRRRSRASSAPASCSRASRASCPHETVSAEYVLEYGIDALELHTDALARRRARARPRRPAGHRRHGAGAVRARRAARRRGRRLRLPDRAGVPRRARAPRAATTCTRCSPTTASRLAPCRPRAAAA